MTKRIGRPPKAPEEKPIARSIKFPRPLWATFAALVPEGQRSRVIQRLVEREVRRLQRNSSPPSMDDREDPSRTEPRPLAPIEIERDPERCAGHPTLAGTRMTVHDIVADVQLCGGDIRRVVADFPHLTVETVEAVMAWYGDHREEIDEILRQRREDYQRLLAQQRSSG
jgi:uncharacterized protein (DUF433 family)